MRENAPSPITASKIRILLDRLTKGACGEHGDIARRPGKRVNYRWVISRSSRGIQMKYLMVPLILSSLKRKYVQPLIPILWNSILNDYQLKEISAVCVMIYWNDPTTFLLYLDEHRWTGWCLQWCLNSQSKNFCKPYGYHLSKFFAQCSTESLCGQS